MPDVVESWNRKWRTLWVWGQIYLSFKTAQAKSRGMPESEKAVYWEKKHNKLAAKVWNNIAELRGWWVKVGQFLSTRSDLLPEAYIDHLERVQDMMPTSNVETVKATVAAEFDRPIEELFQSFDDEPLASASIAQVHKAVLHDGRVVIVKVQHPNVDRTLVQDMHTLTQLAWAFGALEKGLDFGPVLEEWQAAAAFELDFRIELENQDRARTAMLESGIDVVIPETIPELTTKRVMVMEYCEGFKITDKEKLVYYKVDRKRLLWLLCDAFAYQIHIDGMFNGDPHPGNILVQLKPDGTARPVLLDWGLVKSFDESGRIAFSKMVHAVATLNVMGMLDAFEDMGFRFRADNAIDPELYMDAMRVGIFSDAGSTTAMEETEAYYARSKGTPAEKKAAMDSNPIEDWPKDIIFFIRVASLLHGLCIQLDAMVPLLELLDGRAREALRTRYVGVACPLAYTPSLNSNKLEFRIHRLCAEMFKAKALLGSQVVVEVKGRRIVDVAVGRMGPIDMNPVTSKSLFNGYSVCLGILTTLIHTLVFRGQLSYDDEMRSIWDRFSRKNKSNVTVRDVLTHRAGLYRCLSEDVMISHIANVETMTRLLEDVEPDSQYSGRFPYLVHGWYLWQIINCVLDDQSTVQDFIMNEVTKPLGLENDFFYPTCTSININDPEISKFRSFSEVPSRFLFLEEDQDSDDEKTPSNANEQIPTTAPLCPPKEWAERLTSARRDLAYSGISSDEIIFKMRKAQGLEPRPSMTSKHVKTKPKVSLISSYEVAQIKPHVMDPLLFDSAAMHLKIVPGAGGRFTASALAKFYSAILQYKFFPKSVFEDVILKPPFGEDDSTEALLTPSSVYGCGYQIFKCVNLEGHVVNAIGYGDMTGCLCLCIPVLDVSIAILQNDVLLGQASTTQILNHILNGFGLTHVRESCLNIKRILKDVSQVLSTL